MTLINVNNIGYWFVGLLALAWIAEYLAALYLRNRVAIQRYWTQWSDLAMQLANTIQAGWSRDGLGRHGYWGW